MHSLATVHRAPKWRPLSCWFFRWHSIFIYAPRCRCQNGWARLVRIHYIRVKYFRVFWMRPVSTVRTTHMAHILLFNIPICVRADAEPLNDILIQTIMSLKSNREMNAHQFIGDLISFRWSHGDATVCRFVRNLSQSRYTHSNGHISC